MADWAGSLGDEYTIRNNDILNRDKFFEQFLKYGIGSAFEIGCNWGANLLALSQIGVKATGCDVNEKAIRAAEEVGLDAYLDSGTETVMPPESFDLAFTVGVLIHQRTPELILMMQELVRISREFVLFAEYKGTDEEVPYRGERFALFKREYGSIFQALFPDAKLVETGEAGRELGFDDVTYWLYDISNCTSAFRLDEDAWKSLKAGEESEPISSFVGAIGEVSIT